MIDRVAFWAPTWPPDTGASSISTPMALSFLANSFVAIGEIELMSTTIEPGLIPSATPFLPNSTASTSGVSGTMRKTIPAFPATSFDEPQAIAPCCFSSATDAGTMSYT